MYKGIEMVSTKLFELAAVLYCEGAPNEITILLLSSSDNHSDCYT
jgi:hypothetical protein